MSVRAVYKLEKIHDDPLYLGFAFVDETSLLGSESIYDDFAPASSDWDWEAPRLSDVWRPRVVFGESNPDNDYPTIGLSVPAFSQRAVKGLGEMLVANGELLPLVSSIGTYFAFNVTTIVAALDHDQSEILWSVDAAWAMDIEHFAFIPESLAGATIFRPREVPNYFLVTDAFVARARASHLRGMSLRKVWPLDRGELWQRRKPDELR